MVESMQALSAILPILVILTPYIYGFHSQAPSRKWLRVIFKELTGEIPIALQNRKRAWFTDTLEDVNGVATTILKMTAAGAAAGKELIVVTSRGNLEMSDIPIKNFPPIGEFELPEYELQKLSFPPVLQMLDYIQREKFTEIIISTPGPVGLTALLAAKMLNLQTSGIYHTDFPQYIRILREKDLDLLGAAYRRLRNERLPVQLFIVGHGPYSDAFAKSLPEAFFTGYLTGTELATAYASADVFVFPSTTDTFGNVILEAQACGLPVVVSDSGGPKELVEDNANGLITKSHDVDDLARAIRALVMDPALRDRMGKSARNSVIDRSWPNAFGKFWATTEI